jgi:hypothetical protein
MITDNLLLALFTIIYVLSHVLSDSRWGFGLDIGFIDHLHVVTTKNYNTIANFHTLQITTAHTKSFQSAVSSTLVSWQQIVTQ